MRAIAAVESTIGTPDGEALGVLPHPSSFSPNAFPKMRKNSVLASPAEDDDTLEAVTFLGKENEVCFMWGPRWLERVTESKSHCLSSRRVDAGAVFLPAWLLAPHHGGWHTAHAY